VYALTHNPTVVGSNPTPATNQIIKFRESAKSTWLRMSPNRQIADEALAFTGLEHPEHDLGNWLSTSSPT
jgi:hypothetical protein